jgi:hypothetical protein
MAELLGSGFGNQPVDVGLFERRASWPAPRHSLLDVIQAIGQIDCPY